MVVAQTRVEAVEMVRLGVYIESKTDMGCLGGSVG